MKQWVEQVDKLLYNRKVNVGVNALSKTIRGSFLRVFENFEEFKVNFMDKVGLSSTKGG